MTTLRKAAEKALDALIAATPVKAKDPQIQADAIVALREALAQPEPEPVAWAVYDIKHGGSKTLHWPEQHSPNGDPSQFKAVPLYSVPPQRKPLTVEQLRDIKEHQRLLEELGPVWAPMLYYFCQAIERAHGIGEKE